MPPSETQPADVPPGNAPRDAEGDPAQATLESATTLQRVEALVSEFCSLHRWNARRIFLLGEIGKIVRENRKSDNDALFADVLNCLSAEAPNEEISAVFLLRTPPEMAQIYRTHGLQEAIRFLEQLVAMEDEKDEGGRAARPYYNLACLYYLSSRTSEADDDRKAVSRVRALELLECACALFGSHAGGEGTRGAASTAEERNRCTARAHSLAALVLLSRGEGGRCRGEIEAAFAHDPTIPEARFARGVYLLKQGEYDEAIRELESAAQAAAEDGEGIAEFVFHLARACYKKRELLASQEAGETGSHDSRGQEMAALYRRAVSLLKRTTTIDPHFAVAHFKLGVLTLEEDCEEAMKHFEDALRADPVLVDAVGRVRCPGRCVRCKGTKLKILLLTKIKIKTK